MFKPAFHSTHNLINSIITPGNEFDNGHLRYQRADNVKQSLRLALVRIDEGRAG
jgi:hypothetical protein